MRLSNHAGRAVVLTTDTTGFDVAERSGGAFGPELPDIYERWGEFTAWVSTQEHAGEGEVHIEEALLGSPSPLPRQVFAIGLNYSAHVAESGMGTPSQLPPVFSKWPSSLSGPYTEVRLPAGGKTDWEVELVAIVGATAHQVPSGAGWSYIAGLAVGQDLSERVTQLQGPAPQFGLGKSFPGFSPVGPWLVTTDELSDPDDLDIRCEIDGEEVQSGRTSQLIFSVPRLVEELSRVVTLYPGDLIFTGTPAGIGFAREPQRLLQDGETLTSEIEGIGRLRQTFVA